MVNWVWGVGGGGLVKGLGRFWRLGLAVSVEGRSRSSGLQVGDLWFFSSLRNTLSIAQVWSWKEEEDWIGFV